MTPRDLFRLSHRTSDLPVFFLTEDLLVDMDEAGYWSFICRDHVVVDKISDYFGRPHSDGLILKIWLYPVHTDELGSIKWSRYFPMKHEIGLSIYDRGSLLNCLIAQNFAAKFDLAPKIFGICLIESTSGSRHLAALTEDARRLPDRQLDADVIIRQLGGFCDEYGLEAPFGDMETLGNFVNGRLVDWQYSRPCGGHEAFVKKVYLENTQFGESKYQTAPVIDVEEGIRDTIQRLSDLGIDRIEMKGRTVLDIGCNGGQFLNYAAAQGARYCCGVDWPKVAESASYLSNYIGHFNIKYIGAALHVDFPAAEASKEPFDLILFLSMTTHVGTPDYLHGLGKRMILEVNHPYQVAEALAAIEPHWWYRFRGKARDHGDRHIFNCYSKRYYSDPPI